MFKPSKRIASALGAVTLAGTAGLVAVAPSAGAITANDSVSCTTALGTATGTKQYSIDLAPSSGVLGQVTSTQATFTDGGGVVTNPTSSTLTGTAVTDVQLQMSGAATGTVDLISPTANISVPPGPAPSQTFTATLNIPGAATVGDIHYQVVKVTNTANLTGLGTQVNTCTVTGTNADVAVYTVQPVPVTPAITITPNHGAVIDAPVAVTVSGINYTPNTTILLSGLDASNAPTGDAATATSDASGKFSGTITVTKTSTVNIAAAENAQGKNASLAAFRQDPSAKGVLQQTPGGTVQPGPLAMQQAAGGFTLQSITLNGKPQTMTGSMNQVAVQDFRGGTTGWALTGKVTDFTSDTGGTIPAANLSWTPKCAVSDPASPSTVTSGPAGGVTQNPTLCSQAAKSAGQVTGGQFTADAGVSLSVPAYQLAGNYSAILTLSLS